MAKKSNLCKFIGNSNCMVHMFKVFLVLISMIFFANACNGSVYSFKAFSYPPNSKPHNNDWQYIGMVHSSSNESGPIHKKSKKTILLKVTDRDERTFLEDEFVVNRGSIEADIEWDQFRLLHISIYEVGNKYAKDEYNRNLIADGPRVIMRLKYEFDEVSHKFKRVKVSYK